MAPSSLAGMVDMLFKLLPLRQQLLSKMAIDVMSALVARPSCPLSAQQVGGCCCHVLFTPSPRPACVSSWWLRNAATAHKLQGP
jgi:hypothetical protein